MIDITESLDKKDQSGIDMNEVTQEVKVNMAMLRQKSEIMNGKEQEEFKRGYENKTPQIGVHGAFGDSKHKSRLNTHGQSVASQGEGEETTTNFNVGHPDVLSPKIHLQAGTTNKFSNFGFFAGSPRATHLVGVEGNISDDGNKDNIVEFDIEEAIEENI